MKNFLPRTTNERGRVDELTAAERIAKNQGATEAYIKKEYPDENFISSTSELQSVNKRTKKLTLPENVRIAESRADIKSNEQRRTLEKKLRQEVSCLSLALFASLRLCESLFVIS